MNDDFSLNERTLEVLRTLTNLTLKRRIDARDAKTGKVSSREVAIDAPPPKNPGPGTADWIYVVGRTESGFEKEFRCLPFSAENAQTVELYLDRVLPAWKERPEPPIE